MSIRDAFRTGLPHQRFKTKISSPELPRAFRLEATYVVRMRHVKPEYREGVYVLTFLCPRYRYYALQN